MVIKEGNAGDEFWMDSRVLYTKERILTCYSKLCEGPKFDKLFQTDDNR